MPSATFEARLKRLTADAAPGSGAMPSGVHRDSRSPRERRDAGLARVPAAGLRPERMVWLRLLARMGVPAVSWPRWPVLSLLTVWRNRRVARRAGLPDRSRA